MTHGHDGSQKSGTPKTGWGKCRKQGRVPWSNSWLNFDPQATPSDPDLLLILWALWAMGLKSGLTISPKPRDFTLQKVFLLFFCSANLIEITSQVCFFGKFEMIPLLSRNAAFADGAELEARQHHSPKLTDKPHCSSGNPATPPPPLRHIV